VGPRIGLDEKRNILAPTGNGIPTPRSSSPQPIAIPTALARIPSIGNSKQKSAYVPRVLFRTVSEMELFHCTIHCTLYRRATRHVLTRVAKCINVDTR
jgi:hypothetical protein